jgi:hypothetical protein
MRSPGDCRTAGSQSSWARRRAAVGWTHAQGSARAGAALQAVDRRCVICRDRFWRGGARGGRIPIGREAQPRRDRVRSSVLRGEVVSGVAAERHAARRTHASAFPQACHARAHHQRVPIQTATPAATDSLGVVGLLIALLLAAAGRLAWRIGDQTTELAAPQQQLEVTAKNLLGTKGELDAVTTKLGDSQQELQRAAGDANTARAEAKEQQNIAFARRLANQPLARLADGQCDDGAFVSLRRCFARINLRFDWGDSALQSLALDAQGRRVARNRVNRIEVFDTAVDRALFSCPGDAVGDPSMSPRGDLVAARNRKDRVTLCNARGGRELDVQATSFRWSHNGRFLAGWDESSVWLYDTRHRKWLARASAEQVLDMRFRDDSQAIAVLAGAAATIGLCGTRQSRRSMRRCRCHSIFSLDRSACERVARNLSRAEARTIVGDPNFALKTCANLPVNRRAY